MHMWSRFVMKKWYWSAKIRVKVKRASTCTIYNYIGLYRFVWSGVMVSWLYGEWEVVNPSSICLGRWEKVKIQIPTAKIKPGNFVPTCSSTEPSVPRSDQWERWMCLLPLLWREQRKHMHALRRYHHRLTHAPVWRLQDGSLTHCLCTSVDSLIEEIVHSLCCSWQMNNCVTFGLSQNRHLTVLRVTVNFLQLCVAEHVSNRWWWC